MTAHLLEASPDRAVRAVLALGSNLGDRRATLQSAVDDLAAFEGVRVLAVSPLVETDPVGGVEQPDFLNAVALVSTLLSPLDLLAACQAVENTHGRRRSVRWGPRTLDVDVVVYAGVTAASRVLQLPHPRAHGRAFVLVPWAAVDPEAVLPLPDGSTARIADVLAGLAEPEVAGVRPSREPALVVPT